MDNFRNELKNTNRFDNAYYDDLLKIIDDYVESKPDISIETCKAVIEGLSKLVQKELEQTRESVLLNNSVAKNYKEACRCLSEEWEGNTRVVCGFDSEFISIFDKFVNGMVQIQNSEIVAYIGILRTGHGDISHGKSPFKNQVNDSDLAELVIGITDSISTYMLRKLNQFTEDKILYDDNPEFNAFLDEAYPIDGVVSYSKAIFQQDETDYLNQLEDYRLEKEYELKDGLDEQDYELENDENSNYDLDD